MAPTMSTKAAIALRTAVRGIRRRMPQRYRRNLGLCGRRVLRQGCEVVLGFGRAGELEVEGLKKHRGAGNLEYTERDGENAGAYLIDSGGGRLEGQGGLCACCWKCVPWQIRCLALKNRFRKAWVSRKYDWLMRRRVRLEIRRFGWFRGWRKGRRRERKGHGRGCPLTNMWLHARGRRLRGSMS